MLVDYFKGKKIVISAGPTYERIDPVRFIGNFSSGKMGYALAEQLADLGADVHLVSGPVNLQISNNDINLYPVESALQMYEQCLALFQDSDITIMAAAVADYRPTHQEVNKIKKDGESMQINLTRNPDILSSLGKIKKPHQILIGFALETNNELKNAKDKLERKKADAIVLNSLNDQGAGFKHNTNKITIILKKGLIFEYPLKEKDLVAQDIITCISENFD